MMKSNYLMPLAISLLLSSCSIYQADFDCPPDIGVPCTSSSDIESMIIETESGPDIFLGKQSELNLTGCQIPCSQEFETLSEPNIMRKIWICNQERGDGQCIQGHYIYQEQQRQKAQSLIANGDRSPISTEVYSESSQMMKKDSNCSLHTWIKE